MLMLRTAGVLMTEQNVAYGKIELTKGENWEDGPICNYEGVTCSTEGDNVNEGVVEIDLAGFGLINVIPTEIYKLPSLRVVDFSNNIVDMEFDGIGNADNLEEILINDADLTQLDGIGDAPALKKVRLLLCYT